MRTFARCGCEHGMPEQCVTRHSVQVGTGLARVEIWHTTGELARIVYVHWTEYREAGA